MMENVMTYGVIILLAYVMYSTRKYVGKTTKEVHGNYAKYKMEQMFGKEFKNERFN